MFPSSFGGLPPLRLQPEQLPGVVLPHHLEAVDRRVDDLPGLRVWVVENPRGRLLPDNQGERLTVTQEVDVTGGAGLRLGRLPDSHVVHHAHVVPVDRLAVPVQVVDPLVELEELGQLARVEDQVAVVRGHVADIEEVDRSDDVVVGEGNGVRPRCVGESVRAGHGVGVDLYQYGVESRLLVDPLEVLGGDGLFVDLQRDRAVTPLVDRDGDLRLGGVLVRGRLEPGAQRDRPHGDPGDRGNVDVVADLHVLKPRVEDVASNEFRHTVLERESVQDVGVEGRSLRLRDRACHLSPPAGYPALIPCRRLCSIANSVSRSALSAGELATLPPPGPPAPWSRPALLRAATTLWRSSVTTAPLSDGVAY